MPVRRGFVAVGRASRFPNKFDQFVGDRTLLDRALDALAGAGLDAGIVALRPVPRPGYTQLEDRYGRGPLGAVRTVVERSADPFVLIGADMPGITPRALRWLLAAHVPGTSVVPRQADGTLEVMCAIYAVGPDRVARCWERGGALRDLVREELRAGRARALPASGFPAGTFEDIDTLADLARFRAGRAMREAPRAPDGPGP